MSQGVPLPAAARATAGRGMGLLVTATALIIWETAVWFFQFPIYLLPGPSAILHTLANNLGDLLWAGGLTLFEAIAGLLLGGSLGLGLAILVAFWRRLEQGVLSLAILIKSTPIIAIAPILTIWFGFGLTPKIIITALLTFFPVLVNALSGFRAVDRETIDLLRSLHATPAEIFRHARWPAARPYLFAALKVVAPLSLIGAVVAEWMGASGGLGRSMWLAYTNLNMPALFAAVFVLTGLSSSLYQVVVWLEKRWYFWQ